MSDFILLHAINDGAEVVIKKNDISAIYETDKGTLVCRENGKVDIVVSEKPSMIYAKLSIERIRKEDLK